jgi:carbon-monoxide dehydrogenase medium subunit
MTGSVGDSLVEVKRITGEDGREYVSLPLQLMVQAAVDCEDTPAPLRSTLTALPWQRRAVTTLERAVYSPDRIPEAAAALLALDAQVALGDGTQVSIIEFFARTSASQSPPAALLLSIDRTDCCWGSARVARMPADQPIVAAVAVVKLEGMVAKSVRLALTGVWRETVRLAQSVDLLVGKELDAGQIEAVAAAVAEEVSPVSDYLGSAEYRREMAAILTRRALEQVREGDNRL